MKKSVVKQTKKIWWPAVSVVLMRLDVHTRTLIIAVLAFLFTKGLPFRTSRGQEGKGDQPTADLLYINALKATPPTDKNLT